MQLDRILASDGFRRSRRQSRFLRYIVEQALAGSRERLKGFTIAIDVFDRGTDFDPAVDSIVRVEAGRLRSKLHEYYLEHGRRDTVLIELPRGTYLPVFRYQATPDSPDAATAIHDRSIAVLPFINLSNQPRQEYFSDGMTDMLITELARLKGLKVISLTSVMYYKASARTLCEIAAELNVSYVIEGAVLRERDRVRITCQLIDARTDHHVWADSYERDMTDILVLQQELALKVAGQLSRELLKHHPVEHQQIDADAYEYYLLGRQHRHQLTVTSLKQAIGCFLQAIDRQPDYAAAYTGMASCYCRLGGRGFEVEPPKQIIPLGLEYTRQALALDPVQVEACAFRAVMLLKYEWDWTGARAELDASLAISDSDVHTMIIESSYFESLGEHEQAVLCAERARRLDPLSREAGVALAWQLQQAGRLKEAADIAGHIVDLHGEFWGALWVMGHISLAREAWQLAIDFLERAVSCNGGHTLPLQGLGYAYARIGDMDRMQAIIQKLDDIGHKYYVSPMNHAVIHAGAGNETACYECLERAFSERSRALAWLMVTREFSDMRQQPPFQALAARIGIPGSTVIE